jgi:hypothetical protein
MQQPDIWQLTNSLTKRAWRVFTLRMEDVEGGGPSSVVGILTAYGLDGPGIEIPVGARFSAPVQRPTQPPVQWVPGLCRG